MRRLEQNLLTCLAALAVFAACSSQGASSVSDTVVDLAVEATSEMRPEETGGDLPSASDVPLAEVSQDLETQDQHLGDGADASGEETLSDLAISDVPDADVASDGGCESCTQDVPPMPTVACCRPASCEELALDLCMQSGGQPMESCDVCQNSPRCCSLGMNSCHVVKAEGLCYVAHGEIVDTCADCGAATACCYPDATCTAMNDAMMCMGQGGAPASSCEQCEQFISCCLPGGTSCAALTPGQCGAFGGKEVSGCGECTPPATAPCCTPDGQCTTLTRDACYAAGGHPTENCGQCGPISCCQASGTCDVGFPIEVCASSGQGSVVWNCVECDQGKSPCCLPTGCELKPQMECFQMGGKPVLECAACEFALPCCNAMGGCSMREPAMCNLSNGWVASTCADCLPSN